MNSRVPTSHSAFYTCAFCLKPQFRNIISRNLVKIHNWMGSSLFHFYTFPPSNFPWPRSSYLSYFSTIYFFAMSVNAWRYLVQLRGFVLQRKLILQGALRLRTLIAVWNYHRKLHSQEAFNDLSCRGFTWINLSLKSLTLIIPFDSIPNCF